MENNMQIKKLYSFVWRAVYIIAIVAGLIMILLGLSSLCPGEPLIEHFDMHSRSHEIEKEMGTVSEPTELERKRESEARERVNDGTATDEDWKVWGEYLDRLVHDPDAPERDNAFAGSDMGGTFTTDSMDRGSPGRDS
ncbi:MAG: hypothetical protein ACHQT8_00770 [Chlamydiales bacterium]